MKGIIEEIESKMVEYEYKKFKIINVLAFLESKDMSFSDAFRFLLSQAGSMNISDPFLDNFALLSKIEHGKELLSCLKGKYKETKCKIGDKHTILKTFDSPYHLGQLKECFKEEQLVLKNKRFFSNSIFKSSFTLKKMLISFFSAILSFFL